MVRIPAGVLGATGIVGQRLVRALASHPWFALAAITASERKAGERYRDACPWKLPTPIPEPAASMRLRPTDASAMSDVGIVFSALPADAARSIEPQLAEAGLVVSSNASAFREAPDVPLIIPEVNADHLALLERQRQARGWSGALVTNPNCTVSGIATVLKPLADAFGLRAVVSTSMQAISGAGYPGVAAIDILDNLVPWIPAEEEKIEAETRLLLGSIDSSGQSPGAFDVSAHANRVAVSHGHTVCLSIGFNRPAEPTEVARVLAAYRADPEVSELPSAPDRVIRVVEAPDRPQPRLDRDAEDGMAVTVGRIRPCNLFDIRLVLVVHNAARGAAGGSILNGELLRRRGFVR